MCQSHIDSQTSDLFIHLWLSLSLGIQGKTEEALQQLSILSNRNDLSILYQICIFCICRSASKKDDYEEQISSSKDSIKALLKNSNNFSVQTSILICLSFGFTSLASSLLRATRYHESSMYLRGWLEMIQQNFDKSLEIFNSILSNQSTSSDLMTLYGKAICQNIIQIQFPRN